MFVRATFGPMPVRSNLTSRPAATTERMPDTWHSSAPMYSRTGRKSSIRMRVVVVSQPSERTVSNTQLIISPTMKPNAAPPMNETMNLPVASPTANWPVIAAEMANWKPTMPEASLNSDSPLSTLRWRVVSEASLPKDVTATASVGPSAAPKARPAANGMAGQMECNAKPTAAMVAMASPIASDKLSFTVLNSSDLSMSWASRYSSGAMNSTMNSSGFSCTSWKNGNWLARAPSAICTSGVETLGMNRLRNDDATTMAMIQRISSMTATSFLTLEGRFQQYRRGVRKTLHALRSSAVPSSRWAVWKRGAGR